MDSRLPERPQTPPRSEASANEVSPNEASRHVARPDVHLDELTAMRLADGEAVGLPVTSHAARCRLCTALVSAFRSETAALTSAMALDETELTTLLQARVPGHLAALASGHAVGPVPDVQRDTPASLLAMLATAIVGYFGWILAQPALEFSLDIARRSGALTIVAQYLTNWAFRLVWAFWDVFQTVEALRLLNAPALPLFFLAILAWLAMSLMPQPALRARMATSA